MARLCSVFVNAWSLRGVSAAGGLRVPQQHGSHSRPRQQHGSRRIKNVQFRIERAADTFNDENRQQYRRKVTLQLDAMTTAGTEYFSQQF